MLSVYLLLRQLRNRSLSPLLVLYNRNDISVFTYLYIRLEDQNIYSKRNTIVLRELIEFFISVLGEGV